MSSNLPQIDASIEAWLGKLKAQVGDLNLPTRVFVTGGSGFVGGYLIRALRYLDVDVVALGRSQKACQAVEVCGATSALGGLDDQKCLADALEGCDAVVHCAARKGGTDFSDYLRDNVEATQQLLNRAAQAGVRRFVNLSTGSLIAALDHPAVGMDESIELPLAQWSPYLHSKGLAERAVAKANGSRGMATASLRPCLIWGEDAPFHQNMKDVSNGLLGFVVSEKGAFPYSTVHVFNMIEALAHLLGGKGLADAQAPIAGGAWFVNDPYPSDHPNGLPWREVIARLQGALGAPKRTTSLPAWLLLGGAKAADEIGKSFNKGQTLNAETGVRLFTQSLAPSDAFLRANSRYQGLVGIDEGMRNIRR